MKILELTNFSAGGCGVWARVRREALLLSNKGHTVRVFSSNFTKGSDKIASSSDALEGVVIRRFNAAMPGRGALKYIPGGESYMFWDFKKAMDEAVKFRPDVIIAHCYRHPHTSFALRLATEIGARVFLVTHAPFGRGNTRGLIQKCAVSLYDFFIGRKNLHKFNKIIAISNWEVPYLESLGIKRKNIAIIPNGVNSIFFDSSIVNGNRVLLYTGRLAPIKNLELVINSLPHIKDQHLSFIMRGPGDSTYLASLKSLIKTNGAASRITLNEEPYNERQQIALLDKVQFFILPSKSEGMPQVLIEALARGKIVIASDNMGSADIIRNGYNGYLFTNDSQASLIKTLNEVFALSKGKSSLIISRARATARKYKWSRLINELEKIIS